MRFIADGPSLPDELLTARDAGQVLFFCGAGVSQAKAGLPNFATLAGKVLTLLGSALDSPARRLFQSAQAFEEASGLTGLVATDRIFGMLEREFEPSEVREAVATALKPEPGYGLGAHRIVLDLARTRSGVARLVTTNFDLLFEECDPTLESSNPPRLPDPGRELDFRGIVHIHGRVDPDYRRACDDEFVLSSADFGRAYLADGWATRYIQALLGRFKIVFVGYSADDPPVQYLLEALNRSEDRPNGLYAFQAGEIAQATEQWAHKGVCPLPYSSANQHAALWDTLGAWAERARDVDGWHRQVIAAGVAGPEAALPYQRGIMAHITATTAGARHLAGVAEPPAAEWLAVLDPAMRYGQPGQLDLYDDASERFDPFDAFGLDSDEAPEATDPDDRFASRKVPAGAWDGFASTDEDRRDLPENGAGRFRGGGADQPAKLPIRLWHLGVLLQKVAHQPAALWWAAHQGQLHSHIQQQLEWSLHREAARYPPVMRDGWRALLAAWQQGAVDPDRVRYNVEERANLEGWSSSLVRTLLDCYRPILEVKPAFGVRAPAMREDLTLGEMVHVGVEYPRPHEPLAIPDEHVSYGVSLFRQHIEHAIVLEGEVRGRERIFFDSTRADDGKKLNEDEYGFTGHLVAFTNLVLRMAAVDRDAARREVLQWPVGANEVFTRLRIWAAGHAELVDPTEAGEIFRSLDEESFWSDQHERDLLYALRDRWSELEASDRSAIEGRLLTGNFPWSEPRADEAVINAHYRLNRLQWLRDNGIAFGFDFEAEIAKLRTIAADWEPSFAGQTARRQVGEAYTIETDTDPAALAALPLGEILPAAAEVEGRDFYERVRRAPFRGLAETQPIRALGALTNAMRDGQFEPHAWTSLLNARGEKLSRPRMLTAIGHRVAGLDLDQIDALKHPISEWLRDNGEILHARLPEVFGLVWNALIAALAAHPSPPKFRRSDASWVDDGLNRPAGRMVDAMLKDSARADFAAGAGLPASWRRRFDQLLALPPDHRQHAIAMITPRLNWLFNIDPEWVEARLLNLADQTNADAEAFWGGYFWGARTPQLPLYQRLKPFFFALARNGVKRRDHANKLAGMLLAGWGGEEEAQEPERLIPDVELREILIHADEELRAQMLGYLERWAREPNSRWLDRVIPFLLKVWPRQSAIRTQRISRRLTELALTMPELFADIIEIILPWLKPIRGSGLRLGPFLMGEDGIAQRFPVQLLALLWTVLGEDPLEWPHKIGDVFDEMEKQAGVAGDPRLAELRSRQA